MGVSKVVYDGRTLVDLTDTTATEDTILAGYTAYGADGERIVGTAASTRRVEVNVTLTADGWADGSQSVAVEGVTADATVIVGGDLGSEPEYTGRGVYCCGQGEGTLTFACAETPTQDVVANAAILI